MRSLGLSRAVGRLLVVAAVAAGAVGVGIAYRESSGRRDTSVGTLGRVSATYTLVRAGGDWKVATVSQGTDC